MKQVACRSFQIAGVTSSEAGSRKSFRSASLIVRLYIVLALCGSLHAAAFAQSAFIFPSAVQVGTGSPAQSVGVTIQSAGTISTIRVVTQGAPNLDFSASGTGTCMTASYVAGQTCVVSVIF